MTQLKESSNRTTMVDILVYYPLDDRQIIELADLIAAVYELGLVQGYDDCENAVESYDNPFEKKEGDIL